MLNRNSGKYKSHSILSRRNKPDIKPIQLKCYHHHRRHHHQQHLEPWKEHQQSQCLLHGTVHHTTNLTWFSLSSLVPLWWNHSTLRTTIAFLILPHWYTQWAEKLKSRQRRKYHTRPRITPLLSNIFSLKWYKEKHQNSDSHQ